MLIHADGRNQVRRYWDLQPSVPAEGMSEAPERTTDGKRGAMIEVNIETDFAAKNEKFIAFVAKVLDAVNTAITALTERRAELVEDVVAGEAEGWFRFGGIEIAGFEAAVAEVQQNRSMIPR